MGSAHHLDGMNIKLKFDEIHIWGSEDMNWTKNTWFKSSMTLTMSQPCWNMSSAHHLDGLKIWSKFHDIHSKGSKNMNRIQNTWFKSSNTTGDLDLKLAMLEQGFCTSSSWAEHLTKVS
jgi:hypothetical protein